MITATRWRSIAYAAAIFLVGTVTGASVARIVFRHHHWGSPMRPFEVTRHVRAHLRERLDLTPAQVEKIDPIIEKLGADMWTIHREAAQRVARLMDNAHDQIAAQLTPDQRRKLDKLQEERQNRMGDRPFPFRPGGPPGPKGGHRPPPPGMEFPPPPHGDGPPHHERQPQGPPPGGV